jgi:hypothetical protein
MTTFLSLTPSNWIEPSIEKCVCSYCHEGLEILDSIEKLLSLGLPDGIRQSRRGWGAHLPRTGQSEDTLNYLEAQKLIALFRHHLGEEFIEKVRRDQHPITSRLEIEKEKGEEQRSREKERELGMKGSSEKERELGSGLSFEAKNKPLHLVASATRGIPILKYQRSLLQQLNLKLKDDNEKSGGADGNGIDKRGKGKGRRKKKEKNNETKEQDEEEQRDFLPPDEHYSFTNESACDFCNSIEKLFQLLRSLVSHFHPIARKEWVQVLHLPPPENQTPKGQELYIESWLYTWAYGLEKWRDHLWIAGNQLKKFDEAVHEVTTEFEVWLIDFAMTWSLVQVAKETQSQFFDKKFANDLGVIRYVREANGRIGRHYNDFMSEDKVSIGGVDEGEGGG